MSELRELIYITPSSADPKTKPDVIVATIDKKEHHNVPYVPLQHAEDTLKILMVLLAGWERYTAERSKDSYTQLNAAFVDLKEIFK